MELKPYIDVDIYNHFMNDSETQVRLTARGIQSDLVYPNSLVPIQMFSDCETRRLLNHHNREKGSS